MMKEKVNVDFHEWVIESLDKEASITDLKKHNSTLNL